MAYVVALAGKGGTGKTTLAALLVNYLVRRGLTPVLAVDADPNANLGEALGIEAGEPVSRLLGRSSSALGKLPPGMTNETYIEMCLERALSEGAGVDLLTMGGPEGPGCYCYANNLLRGFMERLASSYRFVVMDNEAGMEHLSRRTTNDVDTLVVTSDATVRGLRSAARIASLAHDLALSIRATCLVVTRVGWGEGPGLLEGALREEAARTGLELAGVVPFDRELARLGETDRPLSELPQGSAALEAAAKVFDVITGGRGTGLSYACTKGRINTPCPSR